MIEIGTIIPKLAQGLHELMQDKEKQKRLFLLECRHNLGILGLTQWKDIHQNMIYEFLNHLKTETTEAILIHFENDIFHLGGQKIFDFFINVEDDGEPSSNDLFIQIITKINLLKIIATIPEEFRANDHSNINKRINNLRTSLLLIIKSLEK